jgi:MSHA biogenesis protein MshP
MALVSAIFLIVVLAGIGFSMMSLSNVEHDTASKSNLSAKVYYGAKAGLDWGIQQAIAAGACAGSTSFTIAQGALNGVNVTVTCTSAAQGATNCGLTGTSTCTTYYLVSDATLGTLGALTYAERRLEATISNIP